MAPIPDRINSIINDFVDKISKETPIKKVVIFGSYAKGSFDDQSDVDIAIFSDYFETMTRTEGISYLLLKALDYNVDLEPIAFTSKEYEEHIGIVDEIRRTGLEVQYPNTL